MIHQHNSNRAPKTKAAKRRKRRDQYALGQASEGTSVESNNGRINFTPKPITVDFDAPLRKHLDKAAINRGWEIYKKDASE